MRFAPPFISALILAAVLAAIRADAAAAGDVLWVGPGAAEPVQSGALDSAMGAMAGGQARLMLIPDPLRAGPGGGTAPPVPQDLPALVVVDSCGWADPAAGMAALWSRLAETPVRVVQPAAGACGTHAVDLFRQAAALPEAEREAALAGAVTPVPAPASPAAGSAGTATARPPDTPPTGGLVITALPPTDVIVATEPAPIHVAGGPLAPVASYPPLPQRRADLPQPSIILGELAALLGADQRGPMGVPRPVRERIRDLDAARFQALLAEGRFDPAGGDYAAAIQTELAAVNCYTGSIDGNWGQGSVAALARFLTAAGQAQTAARPGPALFREVAGAPAIRCPDLRTVTTPARATVAPQAAAGTARAASPRGETPGRSAAPTRSAPARGTATTARTPSARQPVAAAPRGPARGATPAPAGQGAGRSAAPRIDPNLMGSGVFR